MEIDFGEAIDMLANIGVIAGIIFLAVELRQNNRLLTAQARYSLRQYRNDIANTIIAPSVLEATHQYAGNGDASPVEKSAARLAALKVIELWEWQYGEYIHGMLPYENLPIGAWHLWYHGKAEVPIPIREAWESRRGIMNPAFVRFFEEDVIGLSLPGESSN